MARFALSQRLDDVYDPTDADRAMTVAAKTLSLLRACQRVLFANNANMLIGRDDGIELAVKMREVAQAIGLLEDYANGKKSAAFHKALEIEAGLGS
jgi:hypothetical protein